MVRLGLAYMAFQALGKPPVSVISHKCDRPRIANIISPQPSVISNPVTAELYLTNERDT
ncbi:hypothetical protein QT970_26050 [Microcoleus sp. herbarium8]|uniref:hypothetical protein n=1 Tax=Microcoleus sp. herbarium8 TaxID=3055436 RepID=UPI002FD799FD